MCEDDRVECDSDTPLPAAIDDLFEVMMFLEEFIDWKLLGLALGLPYSTLKKISTYSHTIYEYKMEILAAWLQQQDKDPQKGVPSWSVLQAALRRMGENELADKISIGGELSC